MAAEGRVARNPFAGLNTALKAENDRRRRRALTPEESRLLLAAAAASTRTLGGMVGADRKLFYTVALTTGLRRNELGALTPASFRLNAEPPTVTVKGDAYQEPPHHGPAFAGGRGGRTAGLARRQAGQPLFPVAERKRKTMLRADLSAAGIEPVVDGKVIDIHALRVSFITHLALTGVGLAVAQKLARHSDPRLASNVYTSLGLAELHKAVETLPPAG